VLEYIRILRLPIILAVLFVIQNQAFIVLLHIVPELYLRASVVTFALGMLLYGPVVFFTSRLRYWYLLCMSVITSLIFISQYLYYAYFNGFFQVAALKYANQTMEITGAIGMLLSPALLIFMVHVFFVVCVMIYVYIKKPVRISMPWRKKIVMACLIFTIVISGYGYLIYAEKRDWGHLERLYSRPYDLGSLVAKIGVVNYFIEDGVRLLLRKNGITSEEKEFALRWKRASEQQYPYPKQYFGIARGRNLIFLQIESLENAVIGKKMGSQEITPNLNALAKEGFYFSEYFAHINQGNTADAEFITLNSLYAPPGGVAFIDYANNHYVALPALLTGYGYDTYAFHGDVLSFWNRANMYPKLGYQKWFTKSDYVVPRPIGFQDLGDEDFFLQSAQKIKSFKQPFMTTLITLTSHVPFVIPQDLQKISIPKDSSLDQLQKDYIQSAHYTDHAIGVFIERLKEMKLYDRSLIVIFGDHGSFSHVADKLGDGKNTPEPLRDHHVPLIIVAPKTKTGGVISSPASHIDVYPTVINLLGIAAPHNLFGEDILNTKDPVMIKRKIATGTVGAILGSRMAYIGSSDAVFEHGTCEEMPGRKVILVEECRELYIREVSNAQASDIVIRGDLIPLLEKFPAQKANVAQTP